MRRMILGLCAALPLSFSGLAMAQGGDRAISKSAQRPISGEDQSFVMKAANAGLYEVQAAKLALQKGQGDEVKKLAQKMIDDHTKANDKLASIAAKKGITPPTELSGGEKADYDQLKQVSGADFDKLYLQQQMKAHDQALSLFKHESTMGNDPDLKTFAEQTLPTLKKHHSMVERDMHRM